MTEMKKCRKHGLIVVTEKNRGYCEICYPFPRVYCRGCGQPLTNAKHRARGYGARCWAKLDPLPRNKQLETVPYAESALLQDDGSVSYLERIFGDNEQTWRNEF